MNTKKYFTELTLLLLFLIVCVSNSFAQASKSAAPREEKLLNGLKLLIWNQPNAEKTSVRIRVHSGAAFDPQSKEGTMALLSEILFPNEAVKEFFREDLGGSLEITSNYDYIEISATAAPDTDKFLAMLETLSRAVAAPQIDKETTALVRAAQIARVGELEKTPSYVADRAAAKRLFGDYPYGRAPLGTSASLSKIDFADLILARQKFLTPDNATVAIVGNIKPDLAIRAAKRYFGAWVKADKKVPATFTQPEAPNGETLIVEMANLDKSYSRTAASAPARGDKDFFAASLATDILFSKLCYKPSYEAHLLRGIFSVADDKIIASNVSELPINECSRSYRILFKDGKAILPPMTPDDLDKAKAKLLAKTTANQTDIWLDVDTFKLVSAKNEFEKINAVTLADVQLVAENLFKSKTVSVLVTKSAAK